MLLELWIHKIKHLSYTSWFPSFENTFIHIWLKHQLFAVQCWANSNFSVLPYLPLCKVGLWEYQPRGFLVGVNTANIAAVMLLSSSEFPNSYFILMLFSGMCLSKIYWKFIQNSMVKQSSLKMQLFTVHTFSSWKCKCGPTGKFATVCTVISLAHGLMTLFPEGGFWIYGFFWFKGSGMIIDTWQWSCFFILCGTHKSPSKLFMLQVWWDVGCFQGEASFYKILM